MERQAKDGTIYRQVGEDQWEPVTRQAKNGVTYKKVGQDSWAPLEEQSEKPKTSPMMSAVRKGLQGVTAGFSDEAAGAVEAAGRALGFEGAGGPLKDIRASEDGPTLNLDTLKAAYNAGVMRERADLKRDSKDNPGVSTVSEIAGAIVSPVNKILPNASMLKQGAAIGAVTGLGASEADNLTDLAKDTATGAVLGGGMGKVAEKIAPIAQKGVDAVGGLKRKVGEALKDTSEVLSFKSSGAMLKDFRTAADRGRLKEMGRYMLDNGIVQAGDSVEQIAEKAAFLNSQAGQKLDDVYSKASELFKDRMSTSGFDPLRDKNEILQAAKKELGNTVGAESAINNLSKYLDEVAARHGDRPMQKAMADYQKEVADYLPKQRQFLKDKKAYQKSLGSAADDLDQGVLPGTYDDFQRTGTDARQVEVVGQEPNVIRAEPYEYSHQMAIGELPQETPRFNTPRGDDLLPLQQKMVLDERSKNIALREGQQAGMEGLDLVPRSFRDVEATGVQSGRGQMEMPFAPNAPLRPQRPKDIRNPMSPRGAQDIKSSLDEAINYSRNPLAKEPANEKAYSAGRKVIAEKIEKSINELGGDELAQALKQANKEYGLSKEITNISQDRVRRETANRMFGLTDTIAGGAAAGYGAVTGDWKSALAAVALKKGLDRAGTSTMAVIADKVSKKLLANPQMRVLATEQPQVFGATVYNLIQRMEERSPGMVLPKAAEQEERPRKGPEKWVLDGIDKLNQAGISKETLDSLKATKQGRNLLIEASDAAPNSKRMEGILKRIRTSSAGGGE